MSTILKYVDVDVPIKAAYDQWTQFESFPNFMEGVTAVRQLDAKRLHWVAKIDGQQLEWDATISEQIPNLRIAWTSTSGAPNGGAIDFHYLAPDKVRVVAVMDFEPQNAVQNIGDWLGVVDRRVQADLDRFKKFIEGRGGQPTGAWTGRIENHPQDMQPGMPASGMGMTGATGTTGTTGTTASQTTYGEPGTGFQTGADQPSTPPGGPTF